MDDSPYSFTKLAPINEHGEIVGSYSSTEYSFEDSVVPWNQQDRLVGLNDFIHRPDGVPKLWFYESLATNGSRSILVYGLPEEGTFRIA